MRGVKSLDPLTLPLRGLHLIEASAGTGKTYTIATLYLRLLLSGVAIDRLLVVTYTNAAVEELRERIRRRVAEAMTSLESGEAGEAQDPVLGDLLRRLTDRAGARVLLAEAVTRMDEAAVHTIHGFCQRALQEHAFESRAPFEAEFLTEEETLRREIAADFWRRRVAAMDAEGAAWVCAQWANPSKLLAEIAAGLSRDDLRLIPEAAVVGLETAEQRRGGLFGEMRALWADGRPEVVEILTSSGALNRRSYTKGIVTRAVKAMDELMARSQAPAELPRDFDRFTPALLTEKTTLGRTPPAHPFFDLCGELSELGETLASLRRAAFLTEARDFVRTELDRRKAAASQLFFDDLLRRLDAALGGAGGDVLARKLRERYPVALIDEFQDTDPVQYSIFRRLYAGHPACGLYLIGDPKQAIYAFRGADIFTYIRARRDAAAEGAQHTLDTNWRSSSRLVSAVNRLFERSPAPFIYDADIPFVPVNPGPRADDEPLRILGAEPPPLHFWFLPLTEENGTKSSRITKEAAVDTAADVCAGRIADLLNLADEGKATLGDRKLAARDIAVLVRTHREGTRMQLALRQVGVTSVTLSQDSVFLTEEAGELSQVLEAVADGADEALIRGAATTRLLGVPLSELALLASDERRWDDLVERFQGYRERWRGRGFMNALQALLHGERVAARLLSYPDGERRLTNLLQLAELAQMAEREHPGPDGLLRWFADSRAESPQGNEAAQLRLESDEDLVQIVTMHKCKGLEYPVVFIPFPWSSFESKKGPVLFHHPDDLGACLDLGSALQDRHRDLARKEELAQRLRLLYVAVTRAKRLCYLCWGPVNQAEGSALAWLLHPDPGQEAPASSMAGLEPEAVRADLESLADESLGAVAVEDLPPTPGSARRTRMRDPATLSARASQRQIPRDWRIASYSWLAGSGSEPERPDYDQAQTTEPGDAQSPDAGPAEGIFLFPRGIESGYFFHALFEQLDFPAAKGDELGNRIVALLEQYGIDPTWGPVVESTVGHLLDTPLEDAQPLRLRDLAACERLNELEFHFSFGRLDADVLRDALSDFEGYRETADGLAFESVRGLMKGYIDLVFRHQGRYYVADYKSNHLGDRLTDYEAAGIARAMRGHRYHLQYLIYTLALHRYLRRRLSGYDYERHFGGVYYLFLRGMRPESGPRRGVYHARPPGELIERLDGLLVGERR
jgi:exodeoxyribonuclease V beta subunit